MLTAFLHIAGALFGPAMTTWYAFLNRIKFPSPTKALMYRVRTLLCSPLLIRLLPLTKLILKGLA